MTQLDFTVLDIRPERHTVAPNLIARLRVEESSGESVHALLLRAQIRIDVQRRRYSDQEEAGLLDLFGPRTRWSDTLRPFAWLHTVTAVQGFAGGTEVDLVLPCSYDVEVIGARYLHAVREGAVPLEFLFSGTVFARGESGFEVTQIPWDRECRYDLPVSVWRGLMDAFFPNSGWLRVERDVLDALGAYKSARGLISWDATLADLLAAATEAGPVIGEQVAR